MSFRTTLTRFDSLDMKNSSYLVRAGSHANKFAVLGMVVNGAIALAFWLRAMVQTVSTRHGWDFYLTNAELAAMTLTVRTSARIMLLTGLPEPHFCDITVTSSSTCSAFMPAACGPSMSARGVSPTNSTLPASIPNPSSTSA